MKSLKSESVMIHAMFCWLAVALWMTAIFVISASPSVATSLEPAYDFSVKKFGHVVVYGILTALLFGALRLRISRKVHAVLLTAVIAMLYALSDEWHQTFVPGRSGSLRDVGFDALGVLGGALWFGKSK